MLVGNDRDTAAYERKHAILADEILISFVLGVNCNRSIAKESFGTGGSNLNESSATYEGILDVPEMTILLYVINLGIRDRGLAMRTPVDDALTAVDETLLIEALENIANSAAAALIKGKALTGPVAGGAHLFELRNDTSAVLLLPSPSALKEAVTAEVFLGKTFLAHRFNDLSLGCNGGMVGAGKPEGAEARHSLVTDENILKSVVKCVAHMELTGDVWRGNNYRIMFFAVVDFGGEITLLCPHSVESVFKP
jgi:hypothetical protein